MLQIRLSKPANESGGGAKPAPSDTVTVACPDHLILADLPVAKGLGSASANAVIKTVGRRSRRQLGERVHFCVHCDFPIAIYGRLSPCEHAFCLDCARSDSLCYLCDERIQKIQTIKLMEGIFICAAPHCLKSFLKKNEFEAHIYDNHAELLRSNKEKEGNDSEATSARKFSASDSTVQALTPRPVSLNYQVHDREDKIQYPQSRDQTLSRPVMYPNRPPMPPFPGQITNNLSDQQQQLDNNQSQIFDRANPQNHFPQQNFDLQGGLRQESVPVDQNSVLAPPQYGYPRYAPDGSQPFFVPPYEMSTAPDSGPMNFAQNYPRPWNTGVSMRPLEPPMVVVSQGGTTPDGFVNVSGSHGRGFFTGDYNNVVPSQSDGKGNLAVSQPMLPIPPPPLPNRGMTYSGDAPPGFGWQQNERRDSFGGGKE